jgi:hypothetical protein
MMAESYYSTLLRDYQTNFKMFTLGRQLGLYMELSDDPLILTDIRRQAQKHALSEILNNTNPIKVIRYRHRLAQETEKESTPLEIVRLQRKIRFLDGLVMSDSIPAVAPLPNLDRYEEVAVPCMVDYLIQRTIEKDPASIEMIARMNIESDFHNEQADPDYIGDNGVVSTHKVVFQVLLDYHYNEFDHIPWPIFIGDFMQMVVQEGRRITDER